ncbi:MAG TPA: MFS transporter [Acetobacteraceae bacterium]|nr:MFS transporter [Acetobacteraceae bacterium]
MADPRTAPLPPTARQRRWSLAAAIASVTVFGLSIGQVVPLLSLLLEARGTDATVNGINAAAAFAGVIAGPLLAPRGVRAFGIRNFLLLCFALEVAVCPLLKLFDSLDAWFVLRAFSGMLGASIFTSSEAWINLLAGDAGRGRIIGLYATALSAGFGIGPLLLSFTGIQGWPPFLVNAGIIGVAGLPLLRAGNVTTDFGREHGAHPFTMVARAPLILLAVALFGFYEASLLALLPIWGVRLGFSPGLAAATVSAVYIGSVALQLPIGWLSDKMARFAVLRACGGAGLLGAIGIALLARPAPALLGALAVWGGVVTAIYPVALSMAGDRFRGGELVTANAAIIIAYGLGALIGPGLGGAAMDLWDPQGLFWFFVLLFAAFLAATGIGPMTRLTQT